MLHNVGEIAREAEVAVQLVSGRKSQVVVEPIVINRARYNQCSVGCSCSDIIVGESAHIIPCRINYREILSGELLHLNARAVIEVQFGQYVPIVCEVQS